MSRFILLGILVVSDVRAFSPTGPSSIDSKSLSLLGMSSVPTLEGDLEVEKLYDESTFPIKPDKLVKLAKNVIINKGIGLKDDGECLSDDFIFRAAFVETPKADFFKALKSFNLEDSFDLKQ